MIFKVWQVSQFSLGHKGLIMVLGFELNIEY